MTSTAMGAHHYFLYRLYAPRSDMARDPTAWTPAERVIASEHFAYMDAAEQAGTIVVIGRSLDGIGPAIAILDVAAEGAAQDFMARDPFISSGLVHGTVHPFHLAFLRPQLAEHDRRIRSTDDIRGAPWTHGSA
jgi:uncharacterized protein YciI